KPINEEEISDLGWMPFVIGILILLTLRVAAIGNVRSLIDLAVLATYILGFMASRFIYRLYLYGHELNPQPAVKVKPFMPVVIGTKQVANFTIHSQPLIGTYLLVLFSLSAAAVTAYHLYVGRRDFVRAQQAKRHFTH